jgi:hypothetical protein
MRMLSKPIHLSKIEDSGISCVEIHCLQNKVHNQGEPWQGESLKKHHHNHYG